MGGGEGVGGARVCGRPKARHGVSEPVCAAAVVSTRDHKHAIGQHQVARVSAHVQLGAHYTAEARQRRRHMPEAQETSRSRAQPSRASRGNRCCLHFQIMVRKKSEGGNSKRKGGQRA
eukprot:5374297-Pleurochrysis_carterae.AAC.1